MRTIKSKYFKMSFIFLFLITALFLLNFRTKWVFSFGVPEAYEAGTLSKSKNKNGEIVNDNGNPASGYSSKKNSLKQLAYQLSKPQNLYEEEEDDALDNPEMDPELAAYKMELMNKIAHVYWEKAPEILEEMIAEEPINPLWRKKVESYFKKIISEPNYEGTQLITVDCKTTLCKLVLEHDSKEIAKKFQKGPLNRGPLDTDQHGTDRKIENGRIETTVFFAKEGGDPTPFEKMNDRMLQKLES
ncbi:MAG: hypothetical protein QNJ97_15125 [Myxococcota bacterium]|nr:hypothetical protein [Myxococcota bacterium]